MKVVIAIDSFKGSMSSIEAGEAAAAGIRKVTDRMIIFTKASVTWLAGAFFVGKWRWRDVSGIGWVSESSEEQYKKILLDGYDRYQRRNDV